MNGQNRYSWIQVGTIVDYHSIIGGPITRAAMVVREPAQRLAGGQWVCWLRGKAGCVSCDAVTQVAPCRATTSGPDLDDRPPCPAQEQDR